MTAPDRATLARGLGAAGLFALAFGSMIGVGWVTGLGGWLTAAGPLGAMAAFLAGGCVMLCIGLCYAEVTPMLPVAGGEVAYAYKAFGTGKAFLVGWFLSFGYISVSAFEAISVGRVLGFLVPGLERWPLYEVGGTPVFGSHLLLAVVCTAGITGLNYFGAKWAAAFQTWLTAAFLLATVAFVGAALLAGSLDHLELTSASGGWGTGFAGVLAVFVTVPFWFVGFDTIPQAAEETNVSLPPRRLGMLILGSITLATLFYVVLILAVSMLGPVATIVDSDLPTARAFELAFGSQVWSRLILVAALVGLLTSWNGFFLAGSRVLFSLGRGRVISARFGEAHPRYGTPHIAVLVTGVGTVLAPLMGKDAMLAVVNVGSFCIAIAFLGVALSVRRLRVSCPDLERPYRMPAAPLVTAVAAVSAAGMLAVMLVPGSPAALRWPMELGLLGGVSLLGLVAWWAGARGRAQVTEQTRAHLILERFAR